FRGVHFVVSAIEHRYFHTRQGESGKNAAFQRLADTFFHGTDEFLWNRSAMGVVDEFKILSGRLNTQFHFGVLTAATSLLLVGVFVFRRDANRFAISNLRLSNVGSHAKLTLHAVDDDFQVQLAHTGENGLPGIMVDGNTQSRIFLRELTD